MDVGDCEDGDDGHAPRSMPSVPSLSLSCLSSESLPRLLLCGIALLEAMPDNPIIMMALSQNFTFFSQQSDLTPSSQHFRTIWNIIYSSIVTIFACTWIAVHPNVPGAHEPWFIRTRRRVMIFFVALLAPEFIVGWAASQYRTSRYLTKEMNIGMSYS